MKVKNDKDSNRHLSRRYFCRESAPLTFILTSASCTRILADTTNTLERRLLQEEKCMKVIQERRLYYIWLDLIDLRRWDCQALYRSEFCIGQKLPTTKRENTSDRLGIIWIVSEIVCQNRNELINQRSSNMHGWFCNWWLRFT